MYGHVHFTFHRKVGLKRTLYRHLRKTSEKSVKNISLKC